MDLPPWLANEYFDLPTETLVNITATPKLILLANPRRVAVIFAAKSGASFSVGLSNTVSATGLGITVSSNTLPLILTHEDFGPLVNMEWWCVAQAVTTGTVYEINLREWPIKQRTKGAPNVSPVIPTSWRKPRSGRQFDPRQQP